MDVLFLILAILLFLLCAVLIIAEVFVPSGGLLSVLAAAAAGGGLWLFFSHSNTAGWIGVITAIFMIPTVIYLSYKLFPYTPFGKSMLLQPPVRTRGDAIPDTECLKELLGKTGKCMTALRPVGMCDFDGKRLECVSETGYISVGTQVKVIKVEGTQLTVREIES